MDNVTLARLLDETAALLEIDAADPFRVRSYRRAAEAVEQQTQPLSALADDPKALTVIGGIGTRICFPSFEGLNPCSGARSAFSISFSKLTSLGCTMIKLASGVVTCAICVSGVGVP